MTTVEAFIELRPSVVGYNLRHRTTVAQHFTGEDCPCEPERIQHVAAKGESK